LTDWSGYITKKEECVLFEVICHVLCVITVTWTASSRSSDGGGYCRNWWQLWAVTLYCHIWSVWRVHESIAYSHWLPCQSSQCNDARGVVLMEDSWVMCILIGYLTRLVSAMTVLALFWWRILMEKSGNDVGGIVRCWIVLSYEAVTVGIADVDGNYELLHCTVIWSIWRVHESIVYSHWLPCQSSQCNDACGVVLMEDSWVMCILIGYLTTLVSAMMVMALFWWRFLMDKSVWMVPQPRLSVRHVALIYILGMVFVLLNLYQVQSANIISMYHFKNAWAEWIN
jgi:uncharacterized membrane protein YphA (DoxX/SURF4 family)